MYNLLQVRFIYFCITVIYTLCVIVIIMLLRNIKILNSYSYFLPIGLNIEQKNPNYKYILLWTDPKNVPFCYMGEGRNVFVSKNCSHTNCIVTSNRNLLGDYRLFDVIAFHGPEIENMHEKDLPKERLPQQKYVFASIESSDYYPLCTNRFDGYFNWTWTYKLDSEIRWGYIVIKDSNGKIVGPNKNMNWLHQSEMQHVSDQMMGKFKNKTKALAWFVSNCETKSFRERYVYALMKYLNRYNIKIDIYGECGKLKCPREREEDCNQIISDNYHFYLSFENAFSEDYVTEKLLIPLQNNAIPIVYGGANYSRFLPSGSYLNARELRLFALGDKVNELINDLDKYAEFFKWKNHYSYHKTSESIETNEYCQMCALLNDKEAFTKVSVYENLHEWWNPLFGDC